MKDLAVAILEANADTAVELKRFYAEVFGQLGYSVSFQDLAVGKEVPLDNPMDVFIADLSLGRTEDYAGLDIIQKLKRANPDIFVIANSRKSVTYAQAAAKIPTFDLFVHKPKIKDPKYVTHILERLRSDLRRNVRVDIDLENSELSPQLVKPAALRQLKSLLRSITFTSAMPDENSAVSRVVLKRLDGAISGSEVYRMETFTERGLQCVNAVLKISEPHRAREEHHRYLNFVRWCLPYTWRPELIGYATTKNYGALCYAFAYNDERPFNSVASHITAWDGGKVDLAIDRIFAPAHKRWYSEKNVYPGDDLTGYYYNQWFANRTEAEERGEKAFREVISKYNMADPNQVEIEGEAYPMPIGFLLGQPRGPHLTCICHGDMNASNILVSDAGELMFIDFQDTGRGPVFQDFVVFECGFRYYFDTRLSFQELLKRERAQNESGVADVKWSPAVAKLRTYAAQTFESESFSTYLYALALYCLRLLRVRDLHRWQREQLAACLLASEMALIKAGG